MDLLLSLLFTFLCAFRHFAASQELERRQTNGFQTISVADLPKMDRLPCMGPGPVVIMPKSCPASTPYVATTQHVVASVTETITYSTMRARQCPYVTKVVNDPPPGLMCPMTFSCRRDQCTETVTATEPFRPMNMDGCCSVLPTTTKYIGRCPTGCGRCWETKTITVNNCGPLRTISP